MVSAMPKNTPYVSLQNRFSKEEERIKWGVPLPTNTPSSIRSIQKAIEEGQLETTAPQPVDPNTQATAQVEDPITQGVAAIQQKTSQKLRKLLHS